MMRQGAADHWNHFALQKHNQHSLSLGLFSSSIILFLFLICCHRSPSVKKTWKLEDAAFHLFSSVASHFSLPALQSQNCNTTRANICCQACSITAVWISSQQLGGNAPSCLDKNIKWLGNKGLGKAVYKVHAWETQEHRLSHKENSTGHEVNNNLDLFIYGKSAILLLTYFVSAIICHSAFSNCYWKKGWNHTLRA